MNIIITIVVVLLVIIVIGTVAGILIRRTIHKSVDELDNRKNQILNRNISEEISKVKKLKMSGETEQKFESWRKDWDEILESILPSIEEQLVEIEELAGKYRITKAKDQLKWVENRLISVEQQLDVMVEDIDKLVSAEEKNRSEIASIKELYQDLSTELLKKRGSFGETIQALDEVMTNTKQALVAFEESTQNGSYLQARKQLLETKDSLYSLNEKMERIPYLLMQVRSTLPGELSNLQLGIKEMEEDGYHLETFSFHSKIATFKEEIDKAYIALKTLEVDEAAATLEDVQAEIDSMYETLEKEATYKSKLLAQIPVLKAEIEKANKNMKQLLDETTQVEKSYMIASEEVQLQQTLQKDLRNVQSQLTVIMDVFENQKQTFSSIFEMTEDWRIQMEELSTGIEESIDRLRRLRKDELQAQETVSQLRELVLESKRLLYKSNLPGVPVTYVETLDEAEEKINKALEALQSFPLEMSQVEALVQEASAVVEKNSNDIREMVETAQMAELAIQYSNRYRGQDESVRKELDEAEQAFLQYDYEKALSIVQHAVQRYEPDLMNKVSKHMSA
ncbi:septation ring formation regulator EzrA [Alkalihalobacillus sp. LMS6]|uniref:septation ring formation regulator EzrA n=1 Tax=Alkalihalobacillus sp. LMS6 TaxID=2924034 RepID=UPI0020D095D2|nr:septation ring formation regulator EzrA [Alkalihalobacillus sp. LMS6]UTR05317.1 septation ring formation regulator EzrA [Alkalihalobacillus sp. LMS6]